MDKDKRFRKTRTCRPRGSKAGARLRRFAAVNLEEDCKCLSSLSAHSVKDSTRGNPCSHGPMLEWEVVQGLGAAWASGMKAFKLRDIRKSSSAMVCVIT